MWSPRALKAAFRLETRNRTSLASAEPEPKEAEQAIETPGSASPEEGEHWEQDVPWLALLDSEIEDPRNDSVHRESGEHHPGLRKDSPESENLEGPASAGPAGYGTSCSGDGWIARADREGGFLVLARGPGRSEGVVSALPGAVEAAVAGVLPAEEPEEASVPSTVTAIVSLLRAVHQDLRQKSEASDGDGIDCLVAIAARGRIYVVLAGKAACLRLRGGEWEVLAPLGRRARPALGQSPRALIEVTNEPARPMDLLLAVPGGPEHDAGEIPPPAWEVAVGIAEWFLRAEGPLPALDLEPDVSASPHAAIVYGGDLTAFRESAAACADDAGIEPLDGSGQTEGGLPPWLAGAGEEIEAVGPGAGGREAASRRRHRPALMRLLSVSLVLAILIASVFLGVEAFGRKEAFDGVVTVIATQLERADAGVVQPVRASLERGIAASSGLWSALTADLSVNGENEGEAGGEDPALDPAGLRRVIPGQAGGSAAPRRAAASAEPATVGGIEARTEPLTEGIEVFVDERSVGTAPVSVDSVRPGRHRVRFASPDGYHWEEEVMVRAEEVARAVAPFSERETMALVTVRTSAMTDDGLRSQDGNAVVVNGAPQGRTPIDLPLEPGVHGITVEREGLKPIHRVVTLRRGDRLILDLRLDKLPQGSIEHSPPAKLKAGETFILTASYGGVRASPHQRLLLHWAIDGAWVESAMTSIPGAPGSYVIGLPVPEGTGEKAVRYYISTEYADGGELVTPIFRVAIR